MLIINIMYLRKKPKSCPDTGPDTDCKSKHKKKILNITHKGNANIREMQIGASSSSHKFRVVTV